MAEIVARSEAEVADAVRYAREHRRTLEIVGGGTRRSFGRPLQCDDVLSLSALSGIISYEPEELIITAKPGTPLDEIEDALAAKNQRLGFEPQDWRALLGSQGMPTIAGAISANANGPAAVRFGRARDHLLGFRAVNGFGEAYKGGGKVVKNVTGFDLPKLMCGAMGTLGPLTELTFRVFPKPSRTAVFSVADVARVSGHQILRQVWCSPLEATGLAYIPKVSAAGSLMLRDCGSGAALIRLEGSNAALNEKIAALENILSSESLSEMSDGGAVFGNIAGFGITGDVEWDVWRIYTTPAILNDYQESDREASHRAPWVSDWAGGMLWCASTPGVDVRASIPIAAEHSVLVRASIETRKRIDVFSSEPPARAALTRAVKAAFDPLGLFNPGRMYVGV